MAGRKLNPLLRYLRQVAAPAGGGLSDADLLGRFADSRDEAAFEALVWRHGPLVYGTCRRVLGHAQDAEDAFQAAFLILARKAGAVRRRAAVGPWLYRVAQRVALRVRGRGQVVSPLPDTLPAPTPRDAADEELRRAVRQEIDRLPARYRKAAVLRYVEGRSTAEAASALGCPPGTVLSRLAWARRRLRLRLTARGATLPAALAAAAVEEAAGAVPARWVTGTVGAATAFAAGGRSGAPAVLALEVLRTMFMTRLRIGAVVVFGALAAGTGLLLPGVTPGRVDDAEKPAPPTVDVTITRPMKHTAGGFELFTGRTEAAVTVEVRSRVTGLIEKVAFQPGFDVKRGDLLFELDSRLYRADVAKAQAEIQRAESRLKHAETDLAVHERLREGHAGSQEEVRQRQAARDDARAELLIAQAALERSRLDLEATRILAPIDGRTGRALMDVGNLAGPTTPLVTIVKTDPISVVFNLDEVSYQRMQKHAHPGPVDVEMGLNGETGFPHHGKLEFIDNRANPANGTIMARAAFENPRGAILAGLYARVQVRLGDAREELMVPGSAIRLMKTGEPFVLVVGAGNTIEWRAVRLRTQAGEKLAVITAGVGPDDRVVVDGKLPPAEATIRVREEGAAK
jgi:multidrug efflux system membrane fusion protein